MKKIAQTFIINGRRFLLIGMLGFIMSFSIVSCDDTSSSSSDTAAETEQTADTVSTTTDGTTGTTTTGTSTTGTTIKIDAESVAQDKTALVITFGSGNDANNVTQNITLPTSGSNGTTISWASSNAGVIATDGKVTRPAAGSSDATVTLTATITKGSASDTKVFPLTVKAVVYNLRDTGPAGGLIFYINPNAATDGWKYLEAAPNDSSTTLQWLSTNTWLNGTSVAAGETQTGIGKGDYNTNRILNYKGVRTAAAAKYCDDLIVNAYGDWFLPSKDELNQMYINLKMSGVGGFSDTFYLSSSESDRDYGYRQHFSNGDVYFANKELQPSKVRAVRSF